jgi:hypothetical protein
MPNEFRVKRGLIVEGSGSNLVTVDGVSGRLFSVTDSLSGSLFSVNTVAGLPVIEAFSDNTVRIGQYGSQALFVSQSKIGIGKESSLGGILDVSGSVTVTGSVSATNFTGSLLGTSSWSQNATSASWAVSSSVTITSSHAITASYALSSAGGGGGAAFPFIGSASITGSLSVSGSMYSLVDLGSGFITSSYTMSANDWNDLRQISSSVSMSIHIPTSSLLSVPVGWNASYILFSAIATGSVTFTTASGVTLRSNNGWTRINGQNGAVTVINRATNDWYLVGNIIA